MKNKWSIWIVFLLLSILQLQAQPDEQEFLFIRNDTPEMYHEHRRNCGIFPDRRGVPGFNGAYREPIALSWYRTDLAYAGYGVLLLLLFYAGLWSNTRRLLAKQKALKRTVEERTRALHERTRELHGKNEQIIGSIRYAQKIQQAILPLEERITRHLPPHFILYRPRDIVSGDFYWFYQGYGRVIIAVVDCTGHGVPGAFVSIIGNALLNEIVRELRETDPAKILEHLHSSVRSALKQEQADAETQDGMELCLIVADPRWQWLEFAGARRPLWIVRNPENEAGAAELIEIKGGRSAIGGRQREKQPTFQKERIALQAGDSLYLATDGFIDQNNTEGRRYGSRRLKKFLLQISHLRIKEQEAVLNKELERYQGAIEQRDDITLVGMKL